MNSDPESIKNKQSKSMEVLAKVLGLLSSPVRIKLVNFLSQSPLTVEVLALKMGESVANTSMHLRKMHGLNLVSCRTNGQKRIYSLHPAFFDFWEDCQNFAAQIFPDLFNIGDSDHSNKWHYNDLETAHLLLKQKAVLLDVRPKDEVDISQVPDSIAKIYFHIPAAEINDRLIELPKNKNVLIICRGRLCALSAILEKKLREKKFKAYRLGMSWFELLKYINSI